jgi:integrase
MLIKAKQNGDLPPAELQTWIDNMPSSLAERLIKLGLLHAGRIERNKALDEHVNRWEQVVQARRSNGDGHAHEQASKVRRVLSAIDAARLDDLDPDRVTEAINGFKIEAWKKRKAISQTTRRSYGIAIKDFAKWLAKKLKMINPLADMKLPSPTENVEYERSSLNVKQFRALMKYLETFERYEFQRSRWTAYDRTLIYWTAVCTAYRQKELKRLRVWNLYLNEKPPVISLKARDTKNKEKGEVPIPRDLASALKKYIAGRDADEVLFPFPETRGAIVEMFRRDLAGANINCELPNGEVIDFHSLSRTTPICWWLDVHGLPQKKVQTLSRLKTMRLVQNYSRNLRIEDFRWLDKGPKLVMARQRKKYA